MKNLLVTGITASAALSLLAVPADAFSFQTNATGDGWTDTTSDIWLESIELEDGTMVDEFSLINSATIVENDEYTGGNSGAASTDIGDTSTTGTSVEAPTENELVGNLNNLNLNNIIDTEDSGSFAIDLFFNDPVDNLLLWERGMNSALAVQAVDGAGNLAGNKVTVDFRELSNDYYAGYKINTQEIGGSQKVGSYGLTMADLGVEDLSINGFRFFSDSSFNGPDWKIMGTNATRPGGPVDVPEPGTILGLAAFSGLLAAARRR
ncbi:PEP-CTERM sorting domain-containing protein [Spirulina sp. CS-785/01]|uniref:exosortase-dependent surface protein XDP2 n=1 Tax=Spirulina sp. CS-785/01 TaxID=3021716 RepID=UPI00232C0787|nr:exosortase-dependent surface protein XDP2 [Spirulina sp. CS-785/01]MDB9315341.1 PEP-CTERM sorting domain-containing protein [Spirulina sp. CS-785/01]